MELCIDSSRVLFLNTRACAKRKFQTHTRTIAQHLVATKVVSTQERISVIYKGKQALEEEDQTIIIHQELATQEVPSELTQSILDNFEQ